MGAAVEAPMLREQLLEEICALGFEYILRENGGPFSCSVTWVKAQLAKLNYTYRAVTAAAQKLPANYQVGYFVLVLVVTACIIIAYFASMT